MLHTAEARQAALVRLTPQERECLKLVAEQRSSKEIAHVLGISKASVDTYCNRARAKLGVSSRREAARIVRALEAERTAQPSAPAPVEAEERAPSKSGRWRLPPVAALGPLQRVGAILLGACVFALAFGVLASGLASLDDVIQTAQAHGRSATGASGPPLLDRRGP